MTRETVSTVIPKRRRCLRVQLDTPLTATITGAHGGTARIRDLALGGAFLETNIPLKVGDSVHVKILAASNSFQSSAKVRSVTHDGYGVEFVDMEPNEDKLLRQLITKLLE